MEVTVIYGKNKLKKDVLDNITIKKVLESMDISLETVVVKKNNKIVMEEENLNDGDVIEVIRVIYGG